MSSLPQKKVSIALKSVPNWSKHGLLIRRTFKFKDFLKSIEFVTRVARKAQKANHHPDIDIRYDKVTLALTTHDEGGLTEKDFSLARECDEIFEKSEES